MIQWGRLYPVHYGHPYCAWRTLPCPHCSPRARHDFVIQGDETITGVIWPVMRTPQRLGVSIAARRVREFVTRSSSFVSCAWTAWCFGNGYPWSISKDKILGISRNCLERPIQDAHMSQLGYYENNDKPRDRICTQLGHSARYTDVLVAR